MVAASSRTPFEIRNLLVANEGVPIGVPIRTGIGYLDHMIDQWNSHAQVGVGLEVTWNDGSQELNNENDLNRFAGTDQVELCTVVGTALGSALREVLTVTTTETASRFCCPLDEALVECILSTPSPTADNGDAASLTSFRYALAPYGIYPKGAGRTKIGALETFAIESFWRALGESSKLQISLKKLRGDNAHHIVESSFKAFSRALRNYLDSSRDLWARGSPNDAASVALRREGRIERTTRETSISVHLSLNGRGGETAVETGIPMLDAFYSTLAREAEMALRIRCRGDLWVDDHHTAEDVSIAVGQCLAQALGGKEGLNRMWVADASTESGDDGRSSDVTTVEVTMDLSNRPCMVHNLHETLGRQEYVDGGRDGIDGDDSAATRADGNGDGAGRCGSSLTCEMFEHCLDSLVMNGRMTVHIVETRSNDSASVSDVALCTAKAFGRALRVCAMVDERRAGVTASSKGTLAV